MVREAFFRVINVQNIREMVMGSFVDHRPFFVPVSCYAGLGQLDTVKYVLMAGFFRLDLSTWTVKRSYRVNKRAAFGTP